MRTFPTTLRELAASEGNPRHHVYAEYRGCRYYVAGCNELFQARAIANVMAKAYPNAPAYVRDRADSTRIDGSLGALIDIYATR